MRRRPQPRRLRSTSHIYPSIGPVYPSLTRRRRSDTSIFCGSLSGGNAVSSLEEGAESDGFWEALGGKGDYPKSKVRGHLALTSTHELDGQ